MIGPAAQPAQLSLAAAPVAAHGASFYGTDAIRPPSTTISVAVM